MNTKTNNSDTSTEVQKSDVALREESILSFWCEHDIFNKTLKKDAPNGEYIFYDGPPFATGLPHYGHILAGTIKDAIPRFWTMNGYHVPRKWGWDCHGLPLENLIEKKLGLATKRDIEEYGIQNFNEQARDAVLEYADDWRQIVPRMGRFVDMDNDYKTMDSSYTESVWHVFSELNKKGLVYEGFKSMHLCPRCGTTLSNFEVNQGYKDIKDIAVTVKLPLLDESGEVTDTSLLVWTTTPWTLPGNLAAAVNKEATYIKTTIKEIVGDLSGLNIEAGQSFIYAKELEKKIFGAISDVEDGAQAGERVINLGEDKAIFLTDWHIVSNETQLIGKRYQPPFPYLAEENFEGKENAWQILHADYVELGEEGTGAVHIAPAYGDDDMKLAQAHNVPIKHHVDEGGHFMEFVGELAGMLVKPKDDDDAGIDHKAADIEVLKLLQASGALFRKETITHSYPHCWRCDTPLLNYATTSWFVEVTKIKDDLVAENNKIHWVPEHVGRARFGKWLEGARDWAVSRQRYWGAPLPIWRNPETKEYKVLGSLIEVQEYVPKSGNQYFVMRHAQAQSNVEAVISTDITADDHLTDAGKEQAKAGAETLKDKHIDLILVSPFSRTKETAEIVRGVLGLSSDQVVEDARLQEIQLTTELQGKNWRAYRELFTDLQAEFMTHPAGGENKRDVQRRAGDLLYEVESKYDGKNILFIGHKSSLFGIAGAAAGAGIDDLKGLQEHFWLDNAVVKEVTFIPYPHNDNFELDYHRPYIDNIELFDVDTKLERVPDVFDCWFESGSMPYGQQHFMGKAQPGFDPENNVGLPAQFIAEGLDQTRGWFYSLIVLGTALFGKSPYENVIVNGMIMAEDGKKLSKKLQNYSAPTDLVNKVGADSMRMYLLNSPIVHGEVLNFSDDEVLDLQRKNIGRLHNVLAMYEMFADGTTSTADSDNVLDRWIVARLNQLIAETTAGYKAYELDKATRPITEFIDDVSVWYLRRSRDRLKSDDAADKALALGTLRHILTELSKVMAPVMPFYAEHLYRAVCAESDPESVHLASWPKGGEVDTQLLSDMHEAREVVTAALEARVKAGIKVRQPLQELMVNSEQNPSVAYLADIVADEVNVKEVTFGHSFEEKVQLDSAITDELKVEGDAREFIRAVQGLRKDAGLEQADRVTLLVQTSDGGQAVIDAHKAEIEKTVGTTGITYGDATGVEVTAGEHSFTVQLKKV